MNKWTKTEPDPDQDVYAAVASVSFQPPIDREMKRTELAESEAVHSTALKSASCPTTGYGDRYSRTTLCKPESSCVAYAYDTLRLLYDNDEPASMKRGMSSKVPSKRYIKAFGIASARCRTESLAYGRCVWSLVEDVQKGDCDQAFRALYECFRAQLKTSLESR